MDRKDLNKLLCDKQLSENQMKEIEIIRNRSQSLEFQSRTSLDYQNNVLNILNRSASIYGGIIVEIGALYGGLSCQLAYLSKAYKRDFYIVEILQENCELIKKHLIEQNLYGDYIHIVCGTVENFFQQMDFLYMPPCFVVVDALHSYNAVRNDLCHILSYIPNTPAIAFHDYALRDDYNGTLKKGWHPIVSMVDRAIINVIGDTEALHPIGVIGSGEIGEKISYYFLKNEPEGVVLFPELLSSSAFTAANVYMAQHGMHSAMQNFNANEGNKDCGDLSKAEDREIIQLKEQVNFWKQRAEVLNSSRWRKLGRWLNITKKH